MSSFTVIAGVSFIGFLLVSLWPKSCLDRAKRRLQEQGEDPNISFGFRRLRAIAPASYRNYLVGLVVSALFGIAFFVSALLAFMNR